MIRITKEQLKKFTPEIMIAVILLVGIFFAWYIKSLGLTKILVDQNSHLNMARQIIDSMTPGISQIGFWPPLLHVLMLPFIGVDILYFSGLAGAFTLVPLLGLAGVFMYALIFLFTSKRLLSCFGALLVISNPYILYFSVTPMMETLFLTNLLGVAYFLAKWLRTNKLAHLIFLSVFVLLSSISRFEGLVLVPLVFLIVFMQLLRSKKQYQEIEANLVIFVFIATLGLLYILVNGWIFGNNPLAFLNSNWTGFHRQQDYFLPTENSIYKSFQYLLHASYYMLGKYQVIIGMISFLLVLTFSRSFQFFTVSLVLLSPFLFDWIALFKGNIIIYVADLPPYDKFFNERYGLYPICFIVFSSLILTSSLNKKIIEKTKNRFGNLSKIIISPLIIILIISNSLFFYQIAYAQKFEVIQKSSRAYPTKNQIDVANILERNYDFGKIFITRALHDFVVTNAGIPIKNYIFESNYKIFDQTLEHPWLFARWVVMYNTSSQNITDWSKNNEKISGKWGYSQEFLNYYDVVMINSGEKLYRINEDAVKRYALEHNLNISEIPSLNKNLKRWNPDIIYDQMKIGIDGDKK